MGDVEAIHDYTPNELPALPQVISMFESAVNGGFSPEAARVVALSWSLAFYVRSGDLDATRSILEALRIRTVENFGPSQYFNLLRTACVRGYTSIARLLLDHGADIEGAPSVTFFFAIQPDPRPLLYIACEEGHVETVRLLLDRGATVDRGIEIATPLMIACNFNRIDIAKLLLDRGADVNGEPSAPRVVGHGEREGARPPASEQDDEARAKPRRGGEEERQTRRRGTRIRGVVRLSRGVVRGHGQAGAG